MTPEELAERVLYNYFSYEGTRELEEYPAWSAELRAGIVAAIRQAIAAEREACAGIAEEFLKERVRLQDEEDSMNLKRYFAGGESVAHGIMSKIRARAEGDSGDKNQ